MFPAETKPSTSKEHRPKSSKPSKILVPNARSSSKRRSSLKKPHISDHFEYFIIDGIKHGCCVLCGTDQEGEYLKTIRMKDSNTSGLISHLKRDHLKVYQEIISFKKKS